MGKFIPDVDVDFANRDEALKGLRHTPASILEKGDLRKHNVGVYFQDIPVDPLTGFASVPYEEAEERGYFKLDFLNLHAYRNVNSEAHLLDLIQREPEWDLLTCKEVCEQLFQLGGVINGIPTYELVDAYKPRSIEDLAIFLALIRPRKKHLIGQEWEDIKQEIWLPGDESLYGFKKAHAISYAHVILVEMNLIAEEMLNVSPEI